MPFLHTLNKFRSWLEFDQNTVAIIWNKTHGFGFLFLVWENSPVSLRFDNSTFPFPLKIKVSIWAVLLSLQRDTCYILSVLECWPFLLTQASSYWRLPQGFTPKPTRGYMSENTRGWFLAPGLPQGPTRGIFRGIQGNGMRSLSLGRGKLHP